VACHQDSRQEWTFREISGQIFNLQAIFQDQDLDHVKISSQEEISRDLQAVSTTTKATLVDRIEVEVATLEEIKATLELIKVATLEVTKGTLEETKETLEISPGISVVIKAETLVETKVTLEEIKQEILVITKLEPKAETLVTTKEGTLVETRLEILVGISQIPSVATSLVTLEGTSQETLVETRLETLEATKEETSAATKTLEDIKLDPLVTIRAETLEQIKEAHLVETKETLEETSLTILDLVLEINSLLEVEVLTGEAEEGKVTTVAEAAGEVVLEVEVDLEEGVPRGVITELIDIVLVK